MPENLLRSAYQNCFHLKALFSSFTVFCLLHDDLRLLELQLEEKVKLTPQFFQNMAVVIDLEKVAALELNFSRIKEILMRYELIPVGIRNASISQIQAAALAHLPLLPAGKTASPMTQLIKNNEADSFYETQLVTQPVRSGMQIYARQRDLIVTSTVSPGAEIMSDGHIHVYGILRGRAMAGMQGNKQARIFCKVLDAELVAIAGHYLTKDERQPFPSQTSLLQIYLENEKIKISEI